MNRKRIIGIWTLIVVGSSVWSAQAVPARGGDVTIVTTLPAQVGTNFKSNIDLSGSVGRKHAVSFNGGGFVVYDKVTGKVVERLSQSEFWTKRVAASFSMDPEAMYNDPKMIYDPLSDRWFATVAPHNISYLAVSASGDPTKLWRGVILPLPTVDPGLTTGVDQHGLYVCAANGDPDPHQALDCLAIPIADATNPSGPVLTHGQSFPNLHFMAYPAMDTNPHKAPDAPAILMNNEFNGFIGSGRLYLYKITWSGRKASISGALTIPLSRTYDTSRPECEQPGRAPKLRASSAVRTESIVVHGGSVFGCHAAKLKPDSRLGIVWYEVRIKDGALLQEGFIDDPRCDYLYPSLALDRAGNLGIGCSRVSLTEYPSIYVMMRAATDPPNTMRPPVLVVPGTTAYTWGTGNPTWCHYSSTCTDPSDPDLLWTCQPFSASAVDKEWCTAWAAFKFSGQPAAAISGIPSVAPQEAGQMSSDSTASEPAAPVQITPAVISSLKTVGTNRYRAYYYDDGATRAYAVVIPEGLKTVRGLLIDASYVGQDTREEWTTCEYYRQFMHLHDFAFVGSADTVGGRPDNVPPLTENTTRGRHYRVFQAFVNSVKRIATAARHPELANAPYVSLGFSYGGGTSFNVMCFAPERTIAAVSYASPYNFKRRATFPVSDALLHVPSISITGEEEQFNAPLPPDVDPSEGPARIDEVLVPYRPKGGEYAWLERQGIGHTYAENGQDVMGIPLLDAAVRARYPKDGDVANGPIKLIDLDPATGWIADNRTWQSGLTKICPAGEFKGDLGHSSWLQNADLAFIYRAYATYDKPLTITSPGNCWPSMPALDAGASVPITVDDSRFPDWETMAIYDGAKKLGEIPGGTAPRFTATNLMPGYHVFSILATDRAGNTRTADPKLVIVRPPAD